MIQVHKRSIDSFDQYNASANIFNTLNQMKLLVKTTDRRTKNMFNRWNNSISMSSSPLNSIIKFSKFYAKNSQSPVCLKLSILFEHDEKYSLTICQRTKFQLYKCHIFHAFIEPSSKINFSYELSTAMKQSFNLVLTCCRWWQRRTCHSIFDVDMFNVKYRIFCHSMFHLTPNLRQTKVLAIMHG